jgi:hypothetical protein
MSRSLPAERHFRAVHAENPGVSERRPAGRLDRGARQETEFHQPPRVVFGKLDVIEQGLFALLKTIQGEGLAAF